LWDGKLYLGGSETAAHGAGYLEGAIEAARRIDRDLTRAWESIDGAVSTPLGTAPTDKSTASVNAASLAQFRAWVAVQGDAALDNYRHRLNQNLVNQQSDQLTQMAILETVEEVYGRAITILDDLPLDTSNLGVERGRSAMMPDVQAPFRDFMQSLVDDVVAFNRTSCALSNFPHEHRPSKEYMQTILRDIAAAWQEFSLAANKVLLSKVGGHG
jgi:monoamine oxidase